MPLLLVASVALQAICLIHVFKTGRPYWWAWIILIGSFLGSFVYIVVELLPDLLHSRRGQHAIRTVRRSLDPDGERRQLEAELERSDTVANRLRLARERLAADDPVAAEALFARCLTGIHADDPDILLGLAEAQFARGDAAATRATLDRLIRCHPQFRSADGHLLYARALQQLGEFDAAVAEYAAVVTHYPGEQARVRYGLLLKQLGRRNEAEQLFAETLRRARLAPTHYRQAQREWIALAEGEAARPV